MQTAQIIETLKMTQIIQVIQTIQTIQTMQMIKTVQMIQAIKTIKTKKLFLVASIISTVIGISLIYYVATKVESAQLSINEITSDMVGRSVTTSGYVSYKSIHPDGHIFLTLSDGQKNKISVPLFAGFVAELRKNHFSINSIQKGTQLQISGVVDEYKGQLQVVPRKVSDIKILNGD